MISKKIKCKVCNKKINLLFSDMNKCKCNKYYCSEHLIEHDCTFNYVDENKNKLLTTLNKVVKSKVKII